MKEKIESTIEKEILPKVSEFGFEIEYVEFVKEGSQNILRVVIDKINSTVNVDDCENISRAIEDIVDRYIKVEYILEVSSPGLERQLKNIKLYKKYIDSNIYVKLFKKINDRKEIEGILKNVDIENNQITLLENENEIIVNIKDIANAHTIYDFAKILKENDNININELKKF